MKVNDIVELCKAGFKADQILQFVAAEHNEGQGFLPFTLLCFG